MDYFILPNRVIMDGHKIFGWLMPVSTTLNIFDHTAYLAQKHALSIICFIMDGRC